MTKLAILGGTPICSALPAYTQWPVGGELEREALKRVLRSGVWGTLGPESKAFAREYADYCGAAYALPVINGTVSLEVILRAMNIGRGDEVIVPPQTFVATVTAVAMVGAMPVFADVDPETYTIDAQSIEAHITERTRAIIAVHLGGRPCDMDAVCAVARRHNLPVVEDAAHAHGSEWKGRRAGSLSEVASFSFQASKNISCGEGGAITTSDQALYEQMWSIHHNGRAFLDGTYDHPVLGTDARMAEWQAAIMRARMERMDRDIALRMRNMARLEEGFSQLGFVEPLRRDARITRNALHVASFRYHPEKCKGLSRDRFIAALAAENVCLPGTGYSEPIYKMELLYSPAFTKAAGRKFMDPTAELPANEHIAREEGCWFYHSSLLGTDEDTGRILEAMARIADQAEALMGGTR